MKYTEKNFSLKQDNDPQFNVFQDSVTSPASTWWFDQLS